MKKLIFAFYLTGALLPSIVFSSASQPPSAATVSDKTQRVDDRMEWFRDARFGMFVHWGAYSALGNEFRGKRGGGYGEHIQRVLKIPMKTYREEVVNVFNPEKFDADAWVRLARHAGMKYFVITAKHHDGFAMWPSKVSAYNIVEATPWKRDPMKELKAACDKYGLKFGFYYSHAFDWGEENGPGNDWDYANPGGDRQLGGREWWQTRPDFIPKARAYVDGKAIPQLLELITNYHPDILWFDTPHKLSPEDNERILKTVREAGPDIVINGRLIYGKGDYDNTADTPVVIYPKSGDWEAIPTTNKSYAWSKFDNSHKPAGFFVRLLAEAAARGGNLLMNVGPMGDGEIDPRDVAILDRIGDWWQVYGESIRGTARTPLPVQTWGQSTRKGNRLYLHVFRWPRDGRLAIGGLKTDIRSAYVLNGATPGVRLTARRINPLDVVLEGLPAEAPHPDNTVIAVDCAGDIQADSRRLLLPGYPVETLHTFDAELRNDSKAGEALVAGIDDYGRILNQPAGRLRYGGGAEIDDFIQGWVNNRQAIVWPVRVLKTATYEVALDYVAAKESAGGEYALGFGTQTVRGTVKESPGSIWAPRRQVDSLGTITLTPGDYDISILAVKIVGKELFNPRQLILTPKN